MSGECEECGHHCLECNCVRYECQRCAGNMVFINPETSWGFTFLICPYCEEIYLNQ